MLILLIGCASAQKNPEAPMERESEAVEAPADLIIAPMFYEYPAAGGIRYAASEQFALCRKSDRCDIPQLPRLLKADIAAPHMGIERQSRFMKTILATKPLIMTRLAVVQFAPGSA